AMYDPQAGWLAPRQATEQLRAENRAKADSGFLDKLTSMGPLILGGVGTGAALGGYFPGVDAAGTFIPAGQTGILEQLGGIFQSDASWGVNPRSEMPFDFSETAGMDDFMEQLGAITKEAGGA